MPSHSSYPLLVKKILNNDPIDKLKNELDQLYPAEMGDLLEALPPDRRVEVWKIIDTKTKGEVLLEVRGEVRQQLIKISDSTDLVTTIGRLQMDEIADLDEKLPNQVIEAIIHNMDSQTKKRYDRVKDYPNDTAGGLMDIDAVAVRADITVEIALRYMRLLRKKYKKIPEHLDSIFVIDQFNKFLGTVELKDLVSLPSDTLISSITNRKIKAIHDNLPSKNVARIFENQDLLSAPVVDSSNTLLGRITVDDIVDVIRKEGEKLIMRPAGLSEKTDVFSPVLDSVKYRAIWHGINLINAFISAFVISLFTHSIEKIVALAILMPVVASMGGVAGNQTLTIVTRGIALDQITKENKLTLLVKESLVGLLNGTLWAVIVAIITYVWLHNYQLSLVFAIALLLSLLFSATAGTLIPIILTKLKVDPALGGSVILVAISDIAGFFIFLSLATIVLT